MQSLFQRAVFSASMILAPVLLAAWFSLCPQYGNPQCPTSADPLGALGAFRAADSTIMSVFLTLGIIIPYVYPLSYLGLGALAKSRSWKLAVVGVILGWLVVFLGAPLELPSSSTMIWHSSATMLLQSNC